MKKNEHIDGIIGIGLFILSIITYFIIIPNQIDDISFGAGSLSPSFFPKVATGIIGVLSIFMIVGNYAFKSQTPISKFGPKSFSIILFLIAYAVGIEIIGYLAATGIFLLALMLYLSKKSWLKYIFIIAVFLVVNYLFFEKTLKLVLPRGYLFQ